MIILDTNVVSELMRSDPAPQVAAWVRDRDRPQLRTTSITLAEIRYGISRLPDGRRKQALLAAAGDIFRAFEDQVLPFDAAAAEHYAAIASNRERSGKPISDSTPSSRLCAGPMAPRSRPATSLTSTAPASKP